MTVEEARESYLYWAKNGTRHVEECPLTGHSFHDWIWRRIDAASLAYDLANAEASIERTRQSVAWA